MNEASENHQNFDQDDFDPDVYLRAALPKTILHIDGCSPFDLEQASPLSHGRRSKHHTQKTPGKGLYIQANCRFTEDGVLQGCNFGRTELCDVITEHRTAEQLIDSENYFANGLEIAAETLLAYRELSKSPDDPERIKLIHIGEHRHRYWQYYQLHKKIKSTNPHVGFVMQLMAPRSKMIVTDGKLVSLKEHMESQPMLIQTNVPVQEKYRRLELRACRIKLASPQYKEASAPLPPMDATIEMTCVLVCFADDPSQKWFLTSSEGSTSPTAQDALMIMKLYEKRRYIDEFFLVFQRLFPAQDFLKTHDNSFVQETFICTTLVYRASQLMDFLTKHPKRKVATLFTPLELKCLHVLRSRYESMDEETDKKKDLDLAMLLEFLDYDAKKTAALMARLGNEASSKKELGLGLKSLIKGYDCLHQVMDFGTAISEAFRKKTNNFEDFDDLPSELTIKI